MMKKVFLFLVFSFLVMAMQGCQADGEKPSSDFHALDSLSALVGRQLQTRVQMLRKLQAAAQPVVSDTIHGRLTDRQGRPMVGVVVSDSYQCVTTDSNGEYRMKPHAAARFVWYRVPAFCAIPVHSHDDHTACVYLPLEKGKRTYNFTLTRLKGGVEKYYKLFVLGDPQITNAISPYYTDASDNPVKKSDLWRFTNQTMADIRQTISNLPSEMPVYGLSMGDDVQYYGGYNAVLERQIRQAMGSTRMILFSVIGNHDQDGKALYRRQWEASFGPEDYSFDRGNEHYVCLNDVWFYRNQAYYSPGQLTKRQLSWLRQDLALTSHAKKVILCYHVPLTFGNNPWRQATPLDIASEQGHYASSNLSLLLKMLAPFKGGFELFCGHTHFAINHEIDFQGQHLMEHCHAAACGNIWQSNINICGTPNGYYVYSFYDGEIVGDYYKGTFWPADKQITLFHADTDFNGESYATDWAIPRGKGAIIANVFNADSRWKVVAIEDGQRYPMERISSKGQDAFATGYHHKYSKSVNYHFISKQNGYLLMNHLFVYVPKRKGALVKVRATDPFGNVYEERSVNVITEPFKNYAHYYTNGK
ncbi:MAG: calcineurin-like phosphoesterase family protein [Prevotella sp.]|nr:calcineurin-like phosphoesterase family protein [Prevotella sp.]